MVNASDLVGWHELSWKGGSFEVCFRPVGIFFCPKFQAPARWEIEGSTVKVDWAKFGKYEFTVGEDGSLDGNAVPKNTEDEGNWRKASFKRKLSPVELAIIGDGAGSEWDFAWSGGSFPVQFKSDGYNHFKCEDFPAHAHWSLDDDKLFINWAEYGKFELKVNAEDGTMEGGTLGGNWETEWRKGKKIRNLIDDRVVEACEHHH